MAHILDVLEERGFIRQVMHEEELRARMQEGVRASRPGA